MTKGKSKEYAEAYQAILKLAPCNFKRLQLLKMLDEYELHFSIVNQYGFKSMYNEHLDKNP